MGDGIGRDEVTRSFKVVRMCFSYKEIRMSEPVVECGVLDVETGEWRRLNPPPYVVNAGSKSVCLNGSIYWFHIEKYFKILALDLHTEEFRDVSIPAIWVTWDTQLVSLEDRLVIAKTKVAPEWKLQIWSMDTEVLRWSKTYSISLANRVVSWRREKRWFTPLAVSKQGNLVFHDNQKRLFKYYPGKDEIRCLSVNTCVISTYLETLVPLPLKPSHRYPDPVDSDVKYRISRCRLFSRESGHWICKALQRNEYQDTRYHVCISSSSWLYLVASLGVTLHIQPCDAVFIIYVSMPCFIPVLSMLWALRF